MQQDAERPRVALGFVRRESATDERYITALEQAGAAPVALWAELENWEQTLRGADGLLLTGGGDIDPRLYDVRDDSSTWLGVDQERDRREVSAYTLARQLGMPVLGICRGMQLLNVIFADGAGQGTLVPDLAVAPVRHVARDGVSAYHEVEVKAGSRLASLVGGPGTYRINSRHHQGMYETQVARGLVVSALAPDQVVEGIEAPGAPFLLGVQCHPERLGEAPEFAAVIRALVLEAEIYRGKRVDPETR